jgi:integrase
VCRIKDIRAAKHLHIRESRAGILRERKARQLRNYWKIYIISKGFRAKSGERTSFCFKFLPNHWVNRQSQQWIAAWERFALLANIAARVRAKIDGALLIMAACSLSSHTFRHMHFVTNSYSTKDLNQL